MHIRKYHRKCHQIICCILSVSLWLGLPALTPELFDGLMFAFDEWAATQVRREAPTLKWTEVHLRTLTEIHRRLNVQPWERPCQSWVSCFSWIKNKQAKTLLYSLCRRRFTETLNFTIIYLRKINSPALSKIKILGQHSSHFQRISLHLFQWC